MNNKILLGIISVLLLLIVATITFGTVTTGLAMAAKPTSFDSNGVEKGWEDAGACTKIQSGTLLASTGETLTTGYDEFGYNYQAHMFNGRYCDYDRVLGGSYCDVELIMKWNDAWISNTDCDEDELLDRHNGYPTYIGSGAWLTNHMSGVNTDGTHWTYFTKIVAKPTADFDCTSIGGVEIWTSFCTIQTVSNDPAYDEHGVQLLAELPGFGAYRP